MNANACKNAEIPWWLQLSKGQVLTFLPRPSFGTVRSEVRILSPRPITHLPSITYGHDRYALFRLVANLWTKFF
jgi:hypothetical protein